tara:strand:+ start:7181 stop:7369 length:189 start_codon:yes stop_codon:yes gene_type:complete
MDFENIKEIAIIRDKLKDNNLCLLFFNEMVETCKQLEIKIIELNTYDENINIDSSDDEERWA